jgi:crossover junction endodeoxyribonuclease RusA
MEVEGLKPGCEPPSSTRPVDNSSSSMLAVEPIRELTARQSAIVAQSWTLTIPAPARWLSANQRTDLRRQTPDRRAWRDTTALLARAAKLPKLDRAHIVATLYFTDRRRRDPHNFYPTIKAAVDGLVDYGLLPDDSSEYLIGPDLRIGPPLSRRRYGPAGELVLAIAAPHPTPGAVVRVTEES